MCLIIQIRYWQVYFLACLAAYNRKMVGFNVIYPNVIYAFPLMFLCFFLGWVLTSVYCYQAQLNLLFSFSMLEGKVFSLKFAAKSIDEAHKTIRSLDPKSKFLFSKLEQPINEDEDRKKMKTLMMKNKKL